MPLLQRAAFVVSFTLTALVLAGLLSRRLYRLCYAFPLWLVAVLASDTLVFAWPERLYTWGVWMAKETIFAVLKLAIAFEIIALAFHGFTSARATASRVTLALLLALLAFLVIGVPAGTELTTLARELQRRASNGIALIYCATWTVVLWYRLPLHRLHRAILRGLVPYLLAFAAANTLTL